jgi:predicted dehydrogenase
LVVIDRVKPSLAAKVKDKLNKGAEMKHLRIGIVGTGKVAKDNYIPCLAGEASVELGFFSRTPTRAQALASEFGGQVFESLHKLMEWNPDAIFVLTRETERLEVAQSLLQLQPRRLFFEKPLVARHGQEDVREQDFLDAKGLLQDASARNCETAMVFNYRFFDHPILARQIIAERSFGKVINVTGLVHYACWSHAIDLIHHFSDPIVELTALQSEGRHGTRMAARDVTASFRTAGDATGTLIGTARLDWTFPLFELTLNFEGGRIHLRDLDGDMEVLDGTRGRQEVHSIPRDRSRWDQYKASFVKSTQAYVQSLRDGLPPPVPGLAGLQELQVEAAIKRSISLRRPVDLPTELPLGL